MPIRKTGWFIIDSQRKYDEFVTEREGWFQTYPSEPTLMSCTTVYSNPNDKFNSQYRIAVNCYRRDEDDKSESGRVA